MTTKEWLSRGWRVDREIRELEQAQQEALALATRTTAGTDGERVDGGGDNSSERAMVAYADKAAEYAELIDSKIRELVGIKAEIIRAVERVENPTLRAVLVARYINFKTWEQIAVEMHYTYQWVCTLHGRALNELIVIDTPSVISCK